MACLLIKQLFYRCLIIIAHSLTHSLTYLLTYYTQLTTLTLNHNNATHLLTYSLTYLLTTQYTLHNAHSQHSTHYSLTHSTHQTAHHNSTPQHTTLHTIHNTHERLFDHHIASLVNPYQYTIIHTYQSLTTIYQHCKRYHITLY